MSNAAPLSVFISYSHRDEDFKDDLVIHLANLKRQGKIRAWQDRDIEAGAEWDAEIQQQLESAEIILLLITPRFLASDYCFDLEMQRAVQRHNEGTARVIPIIVKPCDWQGTPFSKLQVVPKDAKPITKWDDPDDAFLNVVQSIRKAVESLQAKKPLGTTAEARPAVVPHPSTSGNPTATSARPAPLTSSPFSTYNPATFAGRDTETAALTAILQGDRRVVALVGMTGIGKTTLGERVVATLMETPENKQLPYRRFSLDDRSLTPDFSSSGAALLRELGEEPTLADQQDPVNLVSHILSRLRSHPCRLQIDSLERLLRGNEQEGWSEFCAPLWLDLLQKFLAGADCPSQLILTSQDIPADLDTVASRYPQFWHCEPLQGLNPAEQRTLFQNLGLTPTDAEWELLERIGAFYDGHPLVLQVIIEEIRQPPFSGNVARYWQHYAAEFTAAPAATGNTLDRSRLFRRRVRQRVEQSIQRLPEPARQMLCASAVFRRPVAIEFWHAMLPDGDADSAFDTLQDRHLVEYAPIQEAGGSTTLTPQSASGEGTHTALTAPPTSGERSRTTAPLLIRQHNLIRAVALTLLKTDKPTWENAERQAAELWLHDYQPALDAPNTETVRGYLEAFDHYCEVGDWNTAKTILLDQQIGLQLQTWGKYREMIASHHRLIGHLDASDEVACQKWLGNAYYLLSNYSQATLHYQLSLNLAREIDDQQGQWKALNNLGNVSQRLGQYTESTEYLQQTLTLAKEIGDKQGEGTALGNLGLACNSLGRYEEAIDHHQQHLTIAREIGNRQDEGTALGNLGLAYDCLGRYEEAIAHHQRSLTLAREIGDQPGEGNSLGNLGSIYKNLGRYEEAIAHHQQYLTISREIGDQWGEGNALGNLGLAYNSLGRYEEAIAHHQQHLTIARGIGDRRGEGNALGNLGSIYNSLGRYEEAIAHHQQHLTIAREIGDRRGEGDALGSLGLAYSNLGRYEEAIAHHQQYLTITQEIGNQQGEGIALVNLGETQLKQSHYPESLANNQAALAIFREIGIRDGEAEALKNLAELHHALGEIEVARDYCQQALAIAIKLGIPLQAECETIQLKIKNSECKMDAEEA